MLCKVYHSINSEPGNDELIYNNTRCNDSNPFVLHSNIIRNHTGIYRITIQPSNPAGIGDITKKEIQLGTDCKLILYYNHKITFMLSLKHWSLMLLESLQKYTKAIYFMPELIFRYDIVSIKLIDELWY